MVAARSKVVVAVLAVAVVTACSGGESKAGTDSAEGAGAVGTESQNQSANATQTAPISLTAAELDGFEKGLKREIELVREGQERAGKATSSVERGNAIQSTFEENTMKGAVPASGLPFERYHQLRNTLGTLLTTLDFQGKIDGPQSVDTAHADAAMKARLASDPYSVLDPSSAALLKSRLTSIVPIWVEYVNLTAVGG